MRIILLILGLLISVTPTYADVWCNHSSGGGRSHTQSWSNWISTVQAEAAVSNLILLESYRIMEPRYYRENLRRARLLCVDLQGEVILWISLRTAPTCEDDNRGYSYDCDTLHVIRNELRGE